MLLLFITAMMTAAQTGPIQPSALRMRMLRLWMLKDFFVPDWGWRFHGAAGLGLVARRTAQRASV